MNNSYGEFVVTPAIMMGMESVIIDRILFGHSQELHAVVRDNRPSSPFRQSFGLPRSSKPLTPPEERYQPHADEQHEP